MTSTGSHALVIISQQTRIVLIVSGIRAQISMYRSIIVRMTKNHVIFTIICRVRRGAGLSVLSDLSYTINDVYTGVCDMTRAQMCARVFVYLASLEKSRTPDKPNIILKGTY